MTTTNVFAGMDLEKPSSKVLAPPGGQSNICFGGDPEPQQPRQPRQQRQAPAPAPVQQQSTGPAQSCKPQDTAGQTQSNLFGAGDPNNWPKPSSGKRRLPSQDNSANFNLLTGEPVANQANGARGKQQKERMDPANMPAAGGRIGERQVTRTKPPGGESSWSFGGN